MKTIKSLVVALVMTCIHMSAFASDFVGTRDDFRDESIYFLLTTRFYDGDPSNNMQCWENQEANKGCPPWRGDFKGLIEKLDYIKALGFTAIWMTPIVENASGYDYHGYHAIDMSKVDFRLESKDATFENLINEAHSRGIKIILDIVLNHTGNFGEANLFPLFKRDYTKTQSSWIESLIPLREKDGGKLPNNYYKLDGEAQYQQRIKVMKNGDGKNHDPENIYHHTATNWNWDEPSRWWGQIAGDCVDLNTENPKVYNYLVDCYGKFIKMGVDGFRIDTSGHLSPLTMQKVFIPRFEAIAEESKAKRGGGPFFMFGEVCARFNDVTYRNRNVLSPWFYQWKITEDYGWDHDPASWEGLVVPPGKEADHVNIRSCNAFGAANFHDNNQPNSRNILLDGNKYHAVDRSLYSGMSVIDYPMHMYFRNAKNAFDVRHGDHLYNDASYNVCYTDSHDYGPADSGSRPWKSNEEFAEMMNLLFTWRGIPCVYYGSETRFRWGHHIDPGPQGGPLDDSGRGYYGGRIKGSVKATDFSSYTDATGNMAVSLDAPMAHHYRRLNKLRAAIPALRRGQYSTEGCKSDMIAFKRRYTDATIDSYVLVAIGAGASFTGIENGHYVDAITGQEANVTDGTLTVESIKTGNMRIYVLDTSLTKAPGKVGTDGPFLYTATPGGNPELMDPEYDGTEEEPSSNEGPLPDPNFVVNDDWVEPEPPVIEPGDENYTVYFDNSGSGWASVKTWIWNHLNTSENYTGGSWPGTVMTEDDASGYWKYAFKCENPEAKLMVIFNNGQGAQTGDFELVNNGIYNASEYTGVNISSTATVYDDGKDEIRIETGADHSLTIISPTERKIDIVSPDGCISTVHVTTGRNTISLPRGFYIVGGHKVML